MKTYSAIMTLAVGMMVLAAPLAGHHSISGKYDLNKPIFMDGKVTMVQWRNPHVVVVMNVTDKTSGVVSWEIELASVKDLTDFGWKPDTLRTGMEICVEGFPAKDGRHEFVSSTRLTIKSTGDVLSNIGRLWLTPVYNGKDSCSNRGSR